MVLFSVEVDRTIRKLKRPAPRTLDSFFKRLARETPLEGSITTAAGSTDTTSPTSSTVPDVHTSCVASSSKPILHSAFSCGEPTDHGDYSPASCIPHAAAAQVVSVDPPGYIESPAADSKNIQGVPNDIGSCIGKPLDDFSKKMLLQEHWKPPKAYTFPFSFHKKDGKDVRRHATRDHLDKFEWLVLSDIHKGFYCKYCALFVPGNVGGKHKTVPLQQLVSKPLTQFKNLLKKDGSLTTHAKKKLSLGCCEFWEGVSPAH